MRIAALAAGLVVMGMFLHPAQAGAAAHTKADGEATVTRAAGGQWVHGREGADFSWATEGLLSGSVGTKEAKPNAPVLKNAVDTCVYAAIKASSGKFVAAEFLGAHNGALRARSNGVDGAWELFFLEQSGSRWLIRQWEGPYVAAELNFPGDTQGLLRARTTGAIGEWEKFEFYAA